MSKIISIHSFRGGTGKSNLIANLAVLIALQGKRVAIVDTDLQSPGIHALFNLDVNNLNGHNNQKTLNDYLWNKFSIVDAAYDVSSYLEIPRKGKVFLIPASLNPEEITKILSEGYNVTLLNSGFQQLIQELQLDYLFIDTHPGLNKETLLSLAISHRILIILRADSQDFQGTAVTINIARQLQLENILMVINKIPSQIDIHALREQLETTYQVPVVGVLPFLEDMAILGSTGLFCLQYPDHYFTQILKQVAEETIQDFQLIRKVESLT
ncbi:MAG: MinD/ParA family protein [Richelia sp. RM2_1_2]|nr:MinD/ParA family protein [Richelia sp. SM1_7_0]NJN08201.1 MinD/ParA family protein [Richelia sp. RM1_1_1]NJO30225.1 MinD/ParA family protein [Richelia sp. SL_2_1]NJO60616.1 MinD/ParA family protein [Richelia sp. RM2_1_2]